MPKKNNFLWMFNKGGFLIFLYFLSGCSTIPTHERTYASNGKQIITKNDSIEIQITKIQNRWFVFYVNESDVPKCIGTTWKVFDLTPRLNNNLVYVKSHESVPVGYFEERSWDFGDLRVYLGGAGYIEQFNIVEPYKKECAL